MKRPFYKRRGLWAVVGVLAIPAVAIGWYLFSPLFIDKEVNEEFTFAATAEIPADADIPDVERRSKTPHLSTRPRTKT